MGWLESCSMAFGLNPIKVRLVFPERSLHCHCGGQAGRGKVEKAPEVDRGITEGRC